MLRDVPPRHKPLTWLGGEVKSPPLSSAARVEAGFLLRKLQAGENLELPLQDENRTWRVVYRIDRDAVVILDVFAKTSQATPKPAIELCKQRLRRYDEASKGKS